MANQAPGTEKQQPQTPGQQGTQSPGSQGRDKPGQMEQGGTGKTQPGGSQPKEHDSNPGTNKDRSATQKPTNDQSKK
jgi:hypothetical protein